MTVLQFPHLSAINALPKGLLYPHQSDGVSFLISKGRAILGDDMGLGQNPPGHRRHADRSTNGDDPRGLSRLTQAQLAARDQDGRSHGQDRGTRRGGRSAGMIDAG